MGVCQIRHGSNSMEVGARGSGFSTMEQEKIGIESEDERGGGSR